MKRYLFIALTFCYCIFNIGTLFPQGNYDAVQQNIREGLQNAYNKQKAYYSRQNKSTPSSSSTTSETTTARPAVVPSSTSTTKTNTHNSQEFQTQVRRNQNDFKTIKPSPQTSSANNSFKSMSSSSNTSTNSTASSIQATKSNFKSMSLDVGNVAFTNNNKNDIDYGEKGGYGTMKWLGEKSGLNFSNYFSVAEWNIDWKNATSEDVVKWNKNYNRFVRDLYGNDPMFNTFTKFQEEVKTELINLGINVAAVLISAGATAGVGLALTPEGAAMLKPWIEAGIKSGAAFAQSVNKDETLEVTLQKTGKAFVEGAVKGFVGNYQGGKYIVVYTAAKASFDEKGVKKTGVESIGAVVSKYAKGNVLPVTIVIKSMDEYYK